MLFEGCYSIHMLCLSACDYLWCMNSIFVHSGTLPTETWYQRWSISTTLSRKTKWFEAFYCPCFSYTPWFIVRVPRSILLLSLWKYLKEPCCTTHIAANAMSIRKYVFAMQYHFPICFWASLGIMCTNLLYIKHTLLYIIHRCRSSGRLCDLSSSAYERHCCCSPYPLLNIVKHSIWVFI